MMAGSVVVVGDALLDIDLVGSASRLAPDAAVPVLDDVCEHARPGGAALTAALLARDGVDVVLVTALGDDSASSRLRQVLPAGVRVIALPLRGELPRKVRIRATSQPLARLDYGGGTVGSDAAKEADVARVLAHASAVLVSDYGRGVATRLRGLLATFASRTPMVWDPHPRGAQPVEGVRAATPNAAEAAQFALQITGSSAEGGDLRRVADDARVLVRAWRAGSVCVTMGALGALLSVGDDSPLVVPAPVVQCADPCGAGDRFAGAFTLALALGALPSEAARAAVIAASAFVEIGVARVFTSTTVAPVAATGDDVFARVAAARTRGATVVATGGCFDLLHAGHLETLRAARALGDFLVVCVNSDASVARLKGAGRPLVPARDRVRVLEALECVDAVVVFDEDTPSALLSRLRPHIWAKGGDYDGRTLPEAAVLAEWGGQTVVLPYLEGRSTSALVNAASQKHLVSKGDLQ
jgi:rfaE bifunctional protein nucleotidyltransferase chain/domain/rfaE bifunctional protein kinase chain/domain